MIGSGFKIASDLLFCAHSKFFYQQQNSEVILSNNSVYLLISEPLRKKFSTYRLILSFMVLGDSIVFSCITK